jgi:hypothetical protein
MNIYSDLATKSSNWTLGFALMGTIVPSCLELTIDPKRARSLLVASQVFGIFYTQLSLLTVYAPRINSLAGSVFWGGNACVLIVGGYSFLAASGPLNKTGNPLIFRKVLCVSRVIGILLMSMSGESNSSKAIMAISLSALNIISISQMKR